MEFGPLIEPSVWPIVVAAALLVAVGVGAFLLGRWSRRR